MVPIVGVSGSRRGMSDQQRQGFMAHIPPQLNEFHHGCYIGVDRHCHDMILTYTKSRIVVHPPIKTEWKTLIHESSRVMMLPAKSYISRNEDIVWASDLIIAIPLEEEPNGGTWITVGIARRKEKPLIVIYRDGTILKERCA